MTLRLNINSKQNNRSIEDYLNIKTDSCSLIEELIARVDAHQDRGALTLLQESDIREVLPHLDNEQLKYIEKEEQIRAIPSYLVQYLTINQYSSLTLEQSTRFQTRNISI